jgi:peptide/nickel transport system substrate-binding protein
MPDPVRNYEAFAAHLNEAGFEIEPRSAPWSPDYLGLVNEGRCPLYLLGWTGDFADPDNFVGTFFQTEQAAWGFNNPELFDLLDRAEVETDEDARIALYQEANQVIADFLPGVPYAHSRPALAFRANISGYVPSPVSLEQFSTVRIEE